MNSSGLFSELKKHPWIMVLVVLLHVGLVVLLSINLSNDEKPPMPMAQKHNIINAVAVDAKKYDDRKKQKKIAADKKVEDKKAAEKKRLAEKNKAAEKKRQQEAEKKLAIAKKKEAEKKAKTKKLADQKALEKKEKEKERKELARLDAEKKRKIEEARKLEEERKRRADEKAEFERALVEEERREEAAKQLAERTARLQTQRQQYIMQIAQKVENNWLRPATNIAGQSCDVIVMQTMMGDVIDVKLQSCSSDNAFQRSVERAVRKASPLPLPPNPDVFDREINFTFKPHF